MDKKHKKKKDLLQTVILKRLPDGADMTGTVSSNEAANWSLSLAIARKNICSQKRILNIIYVFEELNNAKCYKVQ